MKNHNLRNIVSQFPTHIDLEKLANDFNYNFNKCSEALFNDNDILFGDHYVPLNQIHSLFRYMDKTLEISETYNLNDMQDKMYLLQTAKEKWDKMNPDRKLYKPY